MGLSERLSVAVAHSTKPSVERDDLDRPAEVGGECGVGDRLSIRCHRVTAASGQLDDKGVIASLFWLPACPLQSALQSNRLSTG